MSEEQTGDQVPEPEAPETEAPKKRGRPPGSKNKPKKNIRVADPIRSFKFREDCPTVTHNYQAGKLYEQRMTDAQWKAFQETHRGNVIPNK